MSVERGDTVIARDVNGKATAQKNKNAGRDPRQEIARQDDNSDEEYSSRSHKSIRQDKLAPRLDSAAQIYQHMDAWRGQRHE